jgi:hypothetical protein
VALLSLFPGEKELEATERITPSEKREEEIILGTVMKFAQHVHYALAKLREE